MYRTSRDRKVDSILSQLEKSGFTIQAGKQRILALLTNGGTAFVKAGIVDCCLRMVGDHLDIDLSPMPPRAGQPHGYLVRATVGG
ncbi:hypothetical protein HNP46_005757 [Pseudomonas nitritireducens]|uniref:Uncharacterized protein n=1 Tax=Pseudomonas nitroreducens TaxID=46680 RepID=A0A7W7KQT5_PSENT|nr:hypothetical protein [Pseudomonas nitritireducens]MBB4866850.1 hypothetical protein [Pseudomonas nitritireducens]